MTTTTRLLTIGLAAAGVIGLAGCDGLLGALQPSSIQVSDGMVVYTNPPSRAEGEPLIIGELTWDADHACWYTVGADGSEATTVYPEGTTSTPGEQITFAGGEVVRAGEELAVGGTGWTPGEEEGFTPDMRCGERELHFSAGTGPL